MSIARTEAYAQKITTITDMLARCDLNRNFCSVPQVISESNIVSHHAHYANTRILCKNTLIMQNAQIPLIPSAVPSVFFKSSGLGISVI